MPKAYCEDAAGNLWLGFYNGAWRVTAVAFRLFTESDGVPVGPIRALFSITRALWVASDQNGIARLDDLQAEHPSFVKYTTATDWPATASRASPRTNWGECISEQPGALTVSIWRPIASGTTPRPTGLRAMRFVSLFATGGCAVVRHRPGISRLIPGPDSPPSPPPILISGLRIAGDVQPISALAKLKCRDSSQPDQNQLSIDFVAWASRPARPSYQYRLPTRSGAHPPISARSIMQACHRSYQFQVQAVTADGNASRSLPPSRLLFSTDLQRWCSSRWSR